MFELIQNVLLNRRPVEIFNDDGLKVIEHLGDKGADLILTDPPYESHDISLKFLNSAKVLCTFMPGEKHLEGAAEYHYWIKPESTKNFTKKCGRFVERIAVFRSMKSTFNCLHWSQMTGVHRDRIIHKQEHPFEKPKSLIDRFIMIYTKPGDLVVDPFMGSGTTILSAITLGRRAIGFESNKEYFNLAEKRIGTFYDTNIR